MKNTFENAQVGDRVWSIRYGWGTINIIKDHKIYVVFDHLNRPRIFTSQGKLYDDDLNPTLFWDEVKFDIPQKPIKMKLIHGVEVPDITFKPTLGERFYHPSVDCMSLYNIMTYNGNKWCQFLSENNMCYPCDDAGSTTAALHAKAMLGVREQSLSKTQIH
jgi:hypothetical protein